MASNLIGDGLQPNSHLNIGEFDGLRGDRLARTAESTDQVPQFALSSERFLVVSDFLT